MMNSLSQSILSLRIIICSFFFVLLFSHFFCFFHFNSEGKGKKKGAGNFSEDSGDDLDAQSQKDALNSFAIDLHKSVPGGGGGAKKKTGSKKKGKGKKK